MWKWFNCYLSGRHDYGVWCESGTICLRCPHCGKRSNGWEIRGQRSQAHPVVVRPTAHGSQASPVVVRFPGQDALR